MRRTRTVPGAIQPNGILNQTIACVTDILGRDLAGIAVERAVIGLYFTGVKLTAGVAGTCATPHDATPATSAARYRHTASLSGASPADRRSS